MHRKNSSRRFFPLLALAGLFAYFAFLCHLRTQVHSKSIIPFLRRYVYQWIHSLGFLSVPKLIKNVSAVVSVFDWCLNFDNKMKLPYIKYVGRMHFFLSCLSLSRCKSIKLPTYNTNVFLTVSNSCCLKNLNIRTFHFGNGYYGVINMEFFSHKFCCLWLATREKTTTILFVLHSWSHEISMPASTPNVQSNEQWTKKSIITSWHSRKRGNWYSNLPQSRSEREKEKCRFVVQKMP